MKQKKAALALGLALTCGTLICYWPVTSHGFVSFDDQQYIVKNSHVNSGFIWSGLGWAFVTGYASNWHPLTWVSLMADSQLYGLDPRGYHLTNLFFHVANSLVLFMVLKQMTGSMWRSAFVAALFAWHPLHVESVAWAAERKDVLSTFFFLLTLIAYAAYAQGRGENSKAQSLKSKLAEGVARDECQVTGTARASRITCYLSCFYLLALAFFALGLMSKPMLVTLPFVLLLLDYWPLRRWPSFSFHRSPTPSLDPSASPPRRLVIEKLPFFAMSLAACVVTFMVQNQAKTSFESLALDARIANALVAYARYLAKTLWPANLAAIYTYERHLPVSWVIAASLLLAAVSFWFVLRIQRHPYLLVGWLWYLGTLVPVIGLIQVGAQSMADRYMYIPSIGLFIVLVWGLDALAEPWPRARQALAFVGVSALAAGLACTRFQLKTWQDSETLYRRAIEVNPNNYLAYYFLAGALDETGRHDEALALYSKAIQLKPGYPEAQYDLGTALMKAGRWEEAAEHLAAALSHNPNFADAHDNLGKVLMNQGKLADASAHLLKAVQLAPDDPVARYNLGTLFLKQSRTDEAIACFSQALRLKPDYREAQNNLGVALMRQGKLSEGAEHLAEVVRLDPHDPSAYCNLGLALLDLKQPVPAVRCFSQALQLQPDAPLTHCFLARALTVERRFQEAIGQYREALGLKPDCVEALDGLAWILSSAPDQQLRAGGQAVKLAENACELTDHKQAAFMKTLANAYAEAGQLPKAIATAQRARELALAAGDKQTAAKAEAMLALYQAGRPFREGAE